MVVSQLLFKKETIETNRVQSSLAFGQTFPRYNTQSTRAGLLETSSTEQRPRHLTAPH